LGQDALIGLVTESIETSIKGRRLKQPSPFLILSSLLRDSKLLNKLQCSFLAPLLLVTSMVSTNTNSRKKKETSRNKETT